MGPVAFPMTDRLGRGPVSPCTCPSSSGHLALQGPLASALTSPCLLAGRCDMTLVLQGESWHLSSWHWNAHLAVELRSCQEGSNSCPHPHACLFGVPQSARRSQAPGEARPLLPTVTAPKSPGPSLLITGQCETSEVHTKLLPVCHRETHSSESQGRDPTEVPCGM